MARKLVGIVAVTLFTFGCGFFGEPLVTVHNRSQVEVTNVVLSGSGFEVAVPRIPAGDTVQVKIRPRGETGIALAFDANGKRVTLPRQGYVESHDAYRVTVEIKPDFTADIETNIADAGK